MLFQTQGQAWFFLATMYAGVGVGILYTMNRMIRLALHAGRIATAIIDTLFWLAAAAVMVYCLYWAESGVIRSYMLLGFLCGWVLFDLALSPLLMKVFRVVLKIGKWIAGTSLVRKIMR